MKAFDRPGPTPPSPALERRSWTRIGRLFAALLAILSAAPAFAYDLIGDPAIVRPKSDITGAIVLFSSAAGWGADEQEAASVLAARGRIVIGVDLPSTQKRMAASQDRCIALIGEIEQASHETQKELGAGNYHFPILAGIKGGGALALALAGQIDAHVIERIIAIDPDTDMVFPKEICRRDDPDAYAFPVAALFTPKSDARTQGVADALRKTHPELIVARTDKSIGEALLAPVGAAKNTAAAHELSQELPLIELPVNNPSNMFAILYSGDGGWRDLDKDLAAILQKDGMPVVGIDVLRYFWNAVAPEKTAADLSRIINAYREKWGAEKVLLIGYSFGADILPIVVDLLPAEDRAKIVQISLLGFSDQAAFEVSVSGWLNLDRDDTLPTLPALKKIDPKLVQCFYGEDDDEDACRTLAETGIEIVRTTGGHHFDGDYPALARRILDGAKRR